MVFVIKARIVKAVDVGLVVINNAVIFTKAVPLKNLAKNAEIGKQ